MADYNSELPIRSQLPGQVLPDDVIIKMGDATNPTTQLASVDTHGSQSTIIRDASGNAVTTELNGSQRALDVITQTSGSATGGTAANFSDLVGGIYNTTPPTLTNGQQSALQLDVNGRLLVDASVTFSNDTNYGTVGANTLRTAAQIGNATGAANFNYGTVGAQTLRTASQIGNATGAADFGTGSATAQTLRTTVSNFPTTVDTNYGTVGASTIRAASQIGNATGSADFNFGTVGAQTLRTAAQIGNATGAADFNAGATTAQTLRTTSNQGTPNTAANAWPISITSGGALNSPTNPIFVSESDAAGTPVDSYQTVVALAKAASTNMDYTVTAAKTFYTRQFWATSSGKIKLQVEYETAAGSGTFNTFWVGFNSTAETNILIPCPSVKTQVTGARIRLVITNLDNAAMDVYGTLSGTEQ